MDERDFWAPSRKKNEKDLVSSTLCVSTDMIIIMPVSEKKRKGNEEEKKDKKIQKLLTHHIQFKW